MAIDNIFFAVDGIDHLHDFPDLGDGLECADQRFRILAREAKRLEELRLAAIVWMRGVQEVLPYFVVFHDGEVRVSKWHDRVLSRGAHGRSRGTMAVNSFGDWAIGRLRTAVVRARTVEPTTGLVNRTSSEAKITLFRSLSVAMVTFPVRWTRFRSWRS